MPLDNSLKSTINFYYISALYSLFLIHYVFYFTIRLISTPIWTVQITRPP